MLILAVESSAKPASVAVYDTGGKLLGQYFQNNGFSHSRTLLAMAESLLKNLDIKPSDLDLVAVASGPGSFTGVRIGVSAVKGLAWGLDIPVCGVSTLEAMAYQTPETGVIICPLMDARREQVYNALFEWREGKLVRLTDDRAISMEALVTELKTHKSPCMLIGDGVDVFTSFLNNDSENINSESNILSEPKNYRIAPELMHYQTAYGVALAAINCEPIPATELEPFYLRPSQAEREKQRTN